MSRAAYLALGEFMYLRGLTIRWSLRIWRHTQKEQEVEKQKSLLGVSCGLIFTRLLRLLSIILISCGVSADNCSPDYVEAGRHNRMGYCAAVQ